jgi:GNAT superfamily N-acetyltransferase
MCTPRFEPTPAWQHALDQPGCSQHLLLVLEADGDVVGWCRLFPVRYTGQRPRGAELGIGLLPPYRGQGKGRGLVERSLLWARAAGFCTVHLTTRRTNVRALRLFARCGFVADNLRRDGQVAMHYSFERYMKPGRLLAGSS